MNFDLAVKHIQPTLIIDVGAHLGHWSLGAITTWPDAEFFLIEGNRECEATLRETGLPYKIAVLSDTEKEVDFFTLKNCECATGASYYREQTQFFQDDKDVTLTKIKTQRLDDVVNWQEIAEGCVLLKLDTQGSEKDILRGGPETLKRTDAIIIEVSYEEYNQGAPLFSEICDFLTKSGFYVIEKLGKIVHPVTRNHIQSDILWKRFNS